LAIGNRKSKIRRPTRYRAVVLTSLAKEAFFLSITLTEHYLKIGNDAVQYSSLRLV
jgi:hypothetical protein